jgi:hypothetical protein
LVASSTTGIADLSTVAAPDRSHTVSMSGSSAHVALVGATSALANMDAACTSGTPGSPNNMSVLDLVGYGLSALCAEGGARMTTDLSATTSAARNAVSGSDRCADTNSTPADFTVAAVSGRSIYNGVEVAGNRASIICCDD